MVIATNGDFIHSVEHWQPLKAPADHGVLPGWFNRFFLLAQSYDTLKRKPAGWNTSIMPNLFHLFSLLLRGVYIV